LRVFYFLREDYFTSELAGCGSPNLIESTRGITTVESIFVESTTVESALTSLEAPPFPQDANATIDKRDKIFFIFLLV